MKTLELKLKKYVLIVDAEGLEITQGLIFNKFGNYNLSYYDYICKGSELTEEIASELVDFWQNTANDGFIYENYKTNLPKKETAAESIISAVESKGFHWLDNPIDKPKYYDKILTKNCLIWQEAEEKTFRNPVIFVKKS
jgi:hypothetical protein